MKIIDLLKSGKPTLSFEVFPPKTTDKIDTVFNAAMNIAALKPAFMSVTYGAGGGTSDYTAALSADVQNLTGVPVLAHLTCINSTKAQVHRQMQTLKDYGIENIMALRGDRVPDHHETDYHYASELVAEVAADGSFCIGGACYPETHPESDNSFDDVRHLKEKQDAGCQFFTTQMFFDNDILYNFLYRIREAGIQVPVVAGIMPVTNPSSIKRICRISGAALPQRFCRIVDKYGNDPKQMKQAGIAYATQQIIDLYANGVNAVHIYSMNKPDVAEAILQNVSELLR
ncbi:MAG: methylenetetrahydrofolate reductase [Clostridia bacterium]|nr:methylenetetrahydrofolate reductase [NAD(P)H] [Clostridia bacterium]